MDAAGFVYSSPACKRPEPVPAVPPGQEELEAAEKKARDIVESANRYMMKMQMQMRRQAKEAAESARLEGYRQGYEEGQAQALAENEQTLAQIVSLLREIDRGKESLFKQHEQGMVDLALDIARKVVGAKLSENDKAFIAIFQKAAEGLRAPKSIRLGISQHEARFVTASSEYLLGLVGGAQNLEIQVLEGAQPGTCILETDDALIDASAQRQLEKLVQAVEVVR